jgi:hypothetical protein
MNRVLLYTLLTGAALVAVTAAYLQRNNPSNKPSEGGQQFHTLLLAIAKYYKCLRQVDVEARWAPSDCLTIPFYTPAKARVSASDDAETHGRKLYFLFAKDRDAYLALGGGKKHRAADVFGFEHSATVGDNEPLPESLQALQQFVVKQSWTAVEIDVASERLETRQSGDPLQDADLYASRDGKLYKTGEQRDLFIMFKLDPKTPETDNGWVYGTVTADAKQVASAGRVESCMRCHKEAKHDRLFGLAKPESADKSAKTEK